MPFKITIIAVLLLFSSKCWSQSNSNSDLELYNVITGNNISIEEFRNNKALVLIFTSIKCPYSKLYIDRIASLSTKYKEHNIQFALVNANTSPNNGSESIESMKLEAEKLSGNTLYLADQNLIAKTAFSIEKNPEVIILRPTPSGFLKIYQGAIDDSPQSASMVRENYVQIVLNSVLNNQMTPIGDTKVIGCRIK